MRSLIIAVTAIALLGCSDDDDTQAGAGASSGENGGAGGAGGSGLYPEGGGPLCAPEDASAFVPTWRPASGLHQGLCSEEQVDAFISACIGPDATSSDCAAFQNANEACISCAITYSQANPQGALVQYTETELIDGNVGQCVSLFEGDPSANSCGAAMAATRECTLSACTKACPYDESAPAPFDACVDAAIDSYCHGYSVTSNECEETLLHKGDPVDDCLRASDEDFATYAKRLVNIFCGNP